MKFLRFAVLSLLLAACSSSMGTTNITIYENLNKTGAKYYVAKSLDDVKDNNVTRQIKDVLSKNVSIDSSGTKESVSEALLNAKLLKTDYVIYPTVKKWDMVDELGKAKEATVEVEIVIYDVETSKAVNKAVLNRDCTFGGFSDNGASECVNFDLWIERLIK